MVQPALSWIRTLVHCHLFSYTSPAGSLLAVKLHSENGVIFKGKYEILISLILQWQDNPRKTMRNNYLNHWLMQVVNVG